MDEARNSTDETLEVMIKHLSTIYNNAYRDILDKWNKYMKSHSKKVEDALIELQNAKKSGDPTRVKDAQDHYARTVKNVTVNDERFRAMRDEVLEKITHVNEVAVDYINGNMAHIYTMNYNAFGTEKIAGYSFALVNEEAIKELATTDDLLLPKRKVDVPKDKAWNKKNINSQILQGILQGESIPKMAQRLHNVTDMNRVSAVRTARTMTTAAENKGRQDSFKKATDDGIIMEREWLAAHDSHTRAWHLDLHGKRVGVDEPWENDFGKIMYPGDPTADPANVYNCRCAIRAHVKGFNWNKNEQEDVKNTVVQGKDILDKVKDALSKIIYEKGEPMDFHNADNHHTNPLYDTKYIDSKINCQTCALVYEARRQGYDVVALPRHLNNNVEKLQRELAHNTRAAWINKDTGGMVRPILKNKNGNGSALYNALDKKVGADGERYCIDFNWKQANDGHVINLDRDDNGKLRLIDAQRGTGEKQTWVGDREIKDYLERVKDLQLYRVDDCVPNPKYFNKVVVNTKDVKSTKSFYQLGLVNGEKLADLLDLDMDDAQQYYNLWRVGLKKNKKVDKLMESIK